MKKLTFVLLFLTLFIPGLSFAQNDCLYPNVLIDDICVAQNTDGIPINTGATNTLDGSTSSANTPTTSARGGEKGLVTCGTTANPKDCDFDAFMSLINDVIRFILFKMVVPIAAIMFAYAGFLMVTSGGSTEQWSKAKKIFTNVAFGFIIAVAAWLIIRTILLILGYEGGWIGF